MSDAENDRPEAQPLAGADLDETPTELVDLVSLRPHPRNYKRHPQDQVDHVLETMRLAGVYKNIVIARDGTILMGHGVVEAATQAGRKRISARRLDVDPDDPRALKLVAADNEISGLADRDDAALAAILNDVLGAGVGLLGSGADEDTLARLLSATSSARDGNADPDATPEVPKDPITKRGDLWILGDHRILCGDATNSSDVARLMDGERAVLMATDPPYGISYTKAKDGIPRSGFKDIQKRFGSIENDELDAEGLRVLLDGALREASAVCADKSAIYVWHPSGELHGVFLAALLAAGVLLHRSLVWKKPGFVLSRSGMYHPAHEECFYGWFSGRQPKWFGSKSQTSVWEVGRDAGAGVHPTQKPVELFEIPMMNHTKKGDVCYEPFSGSGSQIIAGERMGRRVFAMEIAPKYVDVAVRRWEEFTGRKAEREEATAAVA